MIFLTKLSKPDLFCTSVASECPNLLTSDTLNRYSWPFTSNVLSWLLPQAIPFWIRVFQSENKLNETIIALNTSVLTRPFVCQTFDLNLNLFGMCIHIVRPAKDLIEQESSMGKVECAFS